MSTHNLCFEQKYEKYQSFLSENFQFWRWNSIYRSVFAVYNVLGESVTGGHTDKRQISFPEFVLICKGIKPIFLRCSSFQFMSSCCQGFPLSRTYVSVSLFVQHCFCLFQTLSIILLFQIMPFSKDLSILYIHMHDFAVFFLSDFFFFLSNIDYVYIEFVQSTCFIQTLNITTKFIIMIIWLAWNLHSGGDS